MKAIPLQQIKPKLMTRTVRTSARPEEVYALFKDVPYSALLNSSLKGDASRFSYIAIDPFLTITSRGKKTRVRSNGRSLTLEEDPFTVISRVLAAYRGKIRPSGPFTAGGIGYFSYDLKNILEDLPRNAVDDLRLPETVFSLHKTLMTFDERSPGKIKISCLVLGEDTEEKVKKHLSSLAGLVSSARNIPASPSRHDRSAGIGSNFTRRSYMNAVKKILEHIKSGDIYQACLTQRFESSWKKDPYDLYLRLNRLSPSPFSAYMDCGTFKIISSSPELFVKMSGGRLETRPMKGTRPRGRNRACDKRLRKELISSKKDAAELLMIVDLERNDMGKVCVPGGVKVVESRRIETHPSVFQSIAVIRGRLSEKDPVKVLRAVFPGGSITGCPKIRSMEILDELEPNARGVCMGAIGHISLHGTMELSVAIRTMVYRSGKVYFHAGGGIVSDSDPVKEYEESLVKAKAMIEAVTGRWSLVASGL